MSLTSASISINNVQSISNTINGNPSSISSLSGNPSSFTSGLVSNTNSTVGDPISTVLTKSLNGIASSGVSVSKKINDLNTMLDSYSSNKNSSVQVVNNNIVVMSTPQNQAQGQLEQQKITTQISSIKNAIGAYQKSVSSLQSITSTINVIQGLLSAQEALLTINPISKATFTVLKQGVKILFLGDMLKSYSSLIGTQMSQFQSQLDQFTSKFMNLQVSLNVQQNASQGNSITPSQALQNIGHQNLNQSSSLNVSNQSTTFNNSNGKTFLLKVVPYGQGQIIGQAIDLSTGGIVVETAPSYIESPDELTSELKSILSS